jgi:K+-sensing histidine kinase KdpD
MAESPSEVALREVERRRRDRWWVAALLLAAVLAAGGMLLVDDAPARLAPWIAAAFVAVSVLFAGSVVAQERRAARVVRALVAEREQFAALEARVAALRTVHDAVTGVAASERLDEAFERLLDAAVELTDADSGATWLRVGESLTVATSQGPGAPSAGTTVGLDEGVAGMAVRDGAPLITGRGGEWAAGAGPSVVAAPLRLPDRIAGALVLQRGEDRPPFDDVDRTAVALFAEQAALALRTATRLDREQERAQLLTQEREQTATLLAATAHDLKAPLSAVIGYVQLLRDRDERIDRDRRLRLYDDVLNEATRTTRLIGDLASASAVAAGAASSFEPVDLAELLRACARTAEGLAHRQGGERQVTVDAPYTVRVLADRGALERVVVNLVDNAVSHSPPGSAVRLSVRSEGDHAVVSVRDHGPGLDPDADGDVFDAFVSRGRGSGLGLYIVRSLVAAHDGEVQLEQLEDGTLVEIHLPSHVPDGADADAPAGTVQAPGG